MFDSFPVCRSILDHWIYCDAEYLKLWITILARARYKNTKKIGMYQGVRYELNRGEFIFGRLKFAKDTGINESKIKRFIAKLIKDEMITLVSRTNKFSIYLVTNYEKYNQKNDQQSDQQNDQEKPVDVPGVEEKPNQQSDQQNGQQVTSKRPADDQQVTTNEEGKEGCKKVGVIINVPYNDIVKAFNDICCSLVKVKALSTSRKDKINTRWNELKTLDKFKELFTKVENSSFLTGNNKNDWKCSFDWLMKNDTNYVKVLEGQYNDKAEDKVVGGSYWDGIDS